MILFFLLLLVNEFCFFCILEIFDLYLDLFLLGLFVLGLFVLDLVGLGLFGLDFVGFLVGIFLVFGGESWRVEVFVLMEGVVEDFDWRGVIEVRIVI